ncbi:unnamed protein product [Calicophoron daubneyi]|uniref:Cysteamine dioxygenase n=1 Tax=Calicophoron daubneyi TaxID=300641 RepID=A0AAV2T9J4_CALDB
MTSKIAIVANLALCTFQQYSLRSAAAVVARNVPVADTHTQNGYQRLQSDNLTRPTQNSPKSASLKPQHIVLPDRLQNLLSSVRALTPKDVGFDPRWVIDSPVYAAPVAYVHIMENEIFSMGIFILRPGSRIPLHDHPGMYGVIRVFYGSLRCRSFSRVHNLKANSSDYPMFPGSRWQSTDFLVARPYQDVIITPESDPQLLSPTDGNLHEITPVDGIAVFLDILAPPYDHDLGTRECHFFKEVIVPHPVPPNPSSWTSDSSTSTHDSSVRDEMTGGGGGCVSNDTNDLSGASMTLNSSNTSKNNDQPPLIYLVETNQPKDYWCESAEYIGPSVI